MDSWTLSHTKISTLLTGLPHSWTTTFVVCYSGLEWLRHTLDWESTRLKAVAEKHTTLSAHSKFLRCHTRGNSNGNFGPLLDMFCGLEYKVCNRYFAWNFNASSTFYSPKETDILTLANFCHNLHCPSEILEKYLPGLACQCVKRCTFWAWQYKHYQRLLEKEEE